VIAELACSFRRDVVVILFCLRRRSLELTFAGRF
jgi:hypothetical protein